MFKGQQSIIEKKTGLRNISPSLSKCSKCRKFIYTANISATKISCTFCGNPMYVNL